MMKRETETQGGSGGRPVLPPTGGPCVCVRAYVCVESLSQDVPSLLPKETLCVCTRVCVCVRVCAPPGESSLENKCRSACVPVCVRACCSNIRSWGRLKKRGGARGGIRKGHVGVVGGFQPSPRGCGAGRQSDAGRRGEYTHANTYALGVGPVVEYQRLECDGGGRAAPVPAHTLSVTHTLCRRIRPDVPMCGWDQSYTVSDPHFSIGTGKKRRKPQKKKIYNSVLEEFKK